MSIILKWSKKKILVNYLYVFQPNHVPQLHDLKDTFSSVDETET